MAEPSGSSGDIDGLSLEPQPADRASSHGDRDVDEASVEEIPQLSDAVRKTLERAHQGEDSLMQTQRRLYLLSQLHQEAPPEKLPKYFIQQEKHASQPLTVSSAMEDSGNESFGPNIHFGNNMVATSMEEVDLENPTSKTTRRPPTKSSETKREKKRTSTSGYNLGANPNDDAASIRSRATSSRLMRLKNLLPNFTLRSGKGSSHGTTEEVEKDDQGVSGVVYESTAFDKPLSRSKKEKRRIDDRLIGLSRNLKDKAMLTMAKGMGYDGAWFLNDVVKMAKLKHKTEPIVGLNLLLQWLASLCKIVANLHEANISLGELSDRTILLSRDLDLMLYQVESMSKDEEGMDSKKSCDLLLLGIFMLEQIVILCSNNQDVAFDLDDLGLTKVVKLEVEIYNSPSDRKYNLEVAKELENLTDKVEHNVKELLKGCSQPVLKASHSSEYTKEPLPSSLIDLVVQSCSPARYKRRNANDMWELLEAGQEDVEAIEDVDDQLFVLGKLLSNKAMQTKTIRLSEIPRDRKPILDNSIPVVAISGAFSLLSTLEATQSERKTAHDEASEADLEAHDEDDNDSYLPPNAEDDRKLLHREHNDDAIKVRQASSQMNSFLRATADHSNTPTGLKTKSHQGEADSKAAFDFPHEEIKHSAIRKIRRRGRSIDRAAEHQSRMTKTELVAEKVIGKTGFNFAREAWDHVHSARNIIQGIDPEDLGKKFDQQQRISVEEAIAIVKKAEELMREEPNLLQLNGPINIVGDIHGQYFDLRNMMTKAGYPNEPLMRDPFPKRPSPFKYGENKERQFLFLGDYVDRGSFSCEVILYLFALKIKYPAQVWLLRGNHESRVVSSFFGFKEECMTKYGVRFFNACVLAFQALPIGATVSTSSGKWLCIHGGISPEVTHLHQFVEIDRFVEPSIKGFLCDVLWADPINDEMISKFGVQEFMSMEFHANPVRGCSYRFGYRALLQFLATNQLVGLIRAHEVQRNGHKVHFTKVLGKGVNMPLVITVFSAPNYCGKYGNYGAFMTLDSVVAPGAESALSKSIYKNVVRNHGKPVEPVAAGCLSFVCPDFVRSFFDPNVSRQIPVISSTAQGHQPVIVSSQGPLSEAERNQAIEKLNDQPQLPLDLLAVNKFNAVNEPTPVRFEHEQAKADFNIQQLCPYMPTDFPGLIKKALQLGEKEKNSLLIIDNAAHNKSSVTISRISLLNERSPQSLPPTPAAEPAVDNAAEEKSEEGDQGFKQNQNWKAFKLLGLTEDAMNNSFSKGELPDEDDLLFKDESEQRDEARFERALSVDSINELNPALVSRKYQAAKESLRQSLINLPSDILEDEHDDPAGEEREAEQSQLSHIKSTDDKQKVEPVSEEDEKVKFTQKEVVALKTLFLLIDRTEKGQIDAWDLMIWSRETGTNIVQDEAVMCVDYIDLDADGFIGFADYLLFAAKCKKNWLEEQFSNMLEETQNVNIFMKSKNNIRINKLRETL